MERDKNTITHKYFLKQGGDFDFFKLQKDKGEVQNQETSLILESWPGPQFHEQWPEKCN